MAGDWIKMQVNLPDKPEVWQMAGALNIDADSVVGKLLRVWAWFDSHTEDGNAHGVSFPLVDRVAGVAGFAEAMFLAGWLEQKGTVLTLPKFARHNGKTGKNRALTNERVAQHRKNKDLEGNAGSNAASVTKTVTREEKRREERNTKVGASDDASTAPPAPPLKAKDLIAEGVTPQMAADWLTLRKAKRLPLTPTAWDDTKAEGQKAGLSPPDTVAKAVANNWAGFKASWLVRDVNGKAPHAANPFEDVH